MYPFIEQNDDQIVKEVYNIIYKAYEIKKKKQFS